MQLQKYFGHLCNNAGVYLTNLEIDCFTEIGNLLWNLKMYSLTEQNFPQQFLSSSFYLFRIFVHIDKRWAIRDFFFKCAFKVQTNASDYSRPVNLHSSLTILVYQVVLIFFLVMGAKINIQIDFWRLKIQFVELDIYSLFFQKSSTD